mmetsp:Transcript_66051/g.214853  ORF Transcript_66051/g.214853 Transcript_66051/m.214853 type:complete len:206 (-) Transcript_66051:1345-1962(-)
MACNSVSPVAHYRLADGSSCFQDNRRFTGNTAAGVDADGDDEDAVQDCGGVSTIDGDHVRLLDKGARSATGNSEGGSPKGISGNSSQASSGGWSHGPSSCIPNGSDCLHASPPGSISNSWLKFPKHCHSPTTRLRRRSCENDGSCLISACCCRGSRRVRYLQRGFGQLPERPQRLRSIVLCSGCAVGATVAHPAQIASEAFELEC